MALYTADTTAEKVASDCRSRIENKTILVTGASPDGLGAAFATIIAKFGPACIILGTRDLSKAEETSKAIAVVAPGVRTWPIELDLGSLKHVREAANKVESLGEHIDVIVNNAGIMAAPYSKTVDGIENHFATNHIGHFLLTNLLLPKILARNQPVRVVNVTSNGFRWSPIRFTDSDFDDGKTYRRWIAYAQSKTANMLFSVSLSHKLGRQNLVSVSVHPGVIMTKLSRHVAMEEFAELGVLDREFGYREHWDEPYNMKTPSQGVATHVFAAFHPSLDSPDKNGSHLMDSNVMQPEHVQSWARDQIEAEKLWALSEKLVGQKFEY